VVLVDTNILAYLLIEGDRTSAAQSLYAKDPDWRSESFVLVEFSNILATYVRTRALVQRQAIELLARAERLVPIVPVVANSQALETATEFGISAYDARFVALAKRLRTRLVTEDTRLQAAVPDWTLPLAHALT
jgi:predicted nucleic acid-binding protein